MAARETYARVAVEHFGVEFITGLEMQERDYYEDLVYELKALVKAAQTSILSYSQYAEKVAGLIVARWPDRAYFIEVGQDDAWVQLYQPYGIPKT